MTIEKNAKIYVAGHRGMVGSAIVRRLQTGGYTNLLTRTRQELDLLCQGDTFDFLAALNGYLPNLLIVIECPSVLQGIS
jgi:nucleoside-diphosphate-sugar epimerase